jgi:protein TonB
MDRTVGVVRNPRVPPPTLQHPSDGATSDAGPATAPAFMVDVVVLSDDLALYEAIRHSVGERNPVWRARSAEESVDLLLMGRCGVLLIDIAAVTTRPATLVEQVVEQFPDVVVVVAGRREDESVLTGLVSDGLVYRFMHKPLSTKRAGMFLNAAIRSHAERRAGRAGEQVLPLVRELHSRVDPRKWLFVGGGLIGFIAVLAAVLIAHFSKPQEPGPATAAAGTSLPAAPLADPVLSRARAALAAGRYDAPPGRNALDLYSAVLLTRPDDVEAHRGFQTTIERLVANAEGAAAAGDAAEARRVAERVLQVDTENARARAVIANLEQPRPVTTVVAAPTLPTEPPLPSTTQDALRAAAPAPAPAPVRASAPAEDADRMTRVPVTRLAPVPAAAPPPPPAPAPTARVVPDPLTPRVVGTGTLPTMPTRRPPPAPLRYYAGPVAAALPIAGYEEPTPEATEVAATAAPMAAEPGVQQRDLEPVATPDPVYPQAALRQGIGGWVEVEYTVNERGSTGDVAVVAAEPRGVFDEAAITAVAAWRYRPRVVNGRPVAQRTSVTLNFSVED